MMEELVPHSSTYGRSVLCNQKKVMNKYYEAFKNEIKSFNYKNEPIEVFDIKEFNLSLRFKEIFPEATNLINKSQKTGLEFKGKSLILFTWEIGNEICGWLCQFDKPSVQLINEHQILIDNIGGIIESFNGPESIEIDEINYNYTFTLNQDHMFVGSLNTDKLDWEEYYVDRCKEMSIEPIDLSNSVFFTKEANGAKYFYDRETKKVKLFSHDHAFRFVEFLPNHPEYTMHNIKGITNFTQFVELTAKQWTKYFEIKRKAAENIR